MGEFLATGPQWLQPFLPTTRMLAVGVPLALLWTLAAGGVAAWLRTRRDVPTPYTRKVFHFLIIPAATAVQLVWGLPGVTVFGSVAAAVVLLAVARADGFPLYEALARPSDAPHRSLFVVVPLLTTALGGVLANVFFSPFAPVGYLVMGWGDAVGEPVGTRWGRHRYPVRSLAGVPATRSLEGSAAVLVVGAVAATLALVGLGVPPQRALQVGALCGAAAAVTEALSTHGLDNLTLQVVTAAVAFTLLP